MKNCLSRNSIWLLILWVQVLPVLGQNLVPNGSFETLGTCPNGFGQIKKAIGWFSSFGTPDIFCSCSINPKVSVPKNIIGFQNAYEGNCFAAIALLYTPNLIANYEFISIKLNRSLIQGERYCISFRISLADTSNYAFNNIGAAFTEGLPKAQYLPHWLPVQWESPDTFLLDDKENWMLVSGQFIADNNADYITIGQFNTKADLNVVRIGNNGEDYVAYYFDSIQLFHCPLQAGVGIPNVFSPNGDGVNDVLPIALKNAEQAKTQIFNRWGSLVFSSTSLQPIWDGTFKGQPVADGVYFVVVEAFSKAGEKPVIEKKAVHLVR